ncbi:MAG TPA: hypothetical protein VN969_14350 [Streptosporangiaceae bacterium]|nr:hypothetical protein [Streptosporangiaceae bacterium]
MATGAVESIQGQVAAWAVEPASGADPAADHSPTAARRTMTAEAILVNLVPARMRPAGVIEEEGMCPPGGSFRLFPACPGMFR